MKKVIEHAIELLSKNIPSVIMMIIEKHGSAPRAAGAVGLVTAEGLVDGTIGGGAIEYQAILKAQELIKSKSHANHLYTLNEKDAQSIGMVCGGTNLVQFLYLQSKDVKKLSVILDKVNVGVPIIEGDKDIDFIVEDKLKSYDTIERDGKKYFVAPLNEEPNVWIFGGGHVSRALAKVLDFLSFRINVVEEREEFLKREDFPKSATLHLVKMEDFNLDIRKEDYVAVITRGHSWDTAVVSQLLSKNLAYLGVIGSKRKSLILKNILAENGYSEEMIDKLYAPIGIDIAAQTPEEIAISISAQMINQYRKGNI